MIDHGKQTTTQYYHQLTNRKNVLAQRQQRGQDGLSADSEEDVSELALEVMNRKEENAQQRNLQAKFINSLQFSSISEMPRYLDCNRNRLAVKNSSFVGTTETQVIACKERLVRRGNKMAGSETKRFARAGQRRGDDGKSYSTGAHHSLKTPTRHGEGGA